MYLDKSLFEIPGNEFCSWINVGILNIEDIKTIGKLANPPVPTTKFGLKLKIMMIDWIKLIISLNGSKILFKENDLCSPLIRSPWILYPYFGTIFISIFPLAPINFILGLSKDFFISFAIDNAGYIWPPVPPPDIINLFFVIFIFNWRAYTKNHTQWYTGHPCRWPTATY